MKNRTERSWSLRKRQRFSSCLHSSRLMNSSMRRLATWMTIAAVLQLHQVQSFTPSFKTRLRRRNQQLRRIGISLFSEDNGSLDTNPSKSELNDYLSHETNFPSLIPDIEGDENECRQGMSLQKMSSFGAIFSIGVVVLLALNTDPTETVGLTEGIGVDTNLNFVEGQVSSIISNVVGAALPRSATDVISVSLGEGIAGVIGAVATVAVTTLFQIPKTNSIEMEQRSLVEEAVADGDYFFTRAAALPLLEAAGLPRFAATVASVVVALVPYEIIKNRYKRQRELEMQATTDSASYVMDSQDRVEQPSEPSLEPNLKIGSETLVPQQIDLVELFSDITKWLEYDVLKRDFDGKLFWNDQVLDSGVEGALFGFLAALSSKLYADVLYSYFGFGPKEKQQELRERNVATSLSLYTSESLSAAALFGVYESVRFPVSEAISALLSGGVDSCLGSDDFSLCMEVFMLNNPPEATWEGQLRSLLTALFSLWNRFESEAAVESTDELVRALVVQLYSLANNLIGLELVY